MYIYKENLPPRPQIHKLNKFIDGIFSNDSNEINQIINVVKYNTGVSLYSDRNYTNLNKVDIFDDCYLIQLPRHYQNSINIELKSKSLIYRFISLRNNNQFYTDWNHTNLPVSNS